MANCLLVRAYTVLLTDVEAEPSERSLLMLPVWSDIVLCLMPFEMNIKRDTVMAKVDLGKRGRVIGESRPDHGLAWLGRRLKTSQPSSAWCWSLAFNLNSKQSRRFNASSEAELTIVWICESNDRIVSSYCL